MKKIISILCVITFLFSLLGFTTFAENSAVTISEDYQTLSVDGQTYSRFNISMLNVSFNHEETNIALTETQQKAVEDVEMNSSEHRNVISATIYFKDGSRLYLTFLRDDCVEEYNMLLNTKSDNHVIDFVWPENNIVTANGKDLFGKEVTLEEKAIEESDNFEVTVSNKKGSLTIQKGVILLHEDNYYYVDYVESNVKDASIYQVTSSENLIIHEITETSLVKNLDKAKEAYWNSEFGIFDNDDFAESLSAIFFIVVFACIPFAILILCLIFAIRSKGIYKKMHRVTYLLCGAELAIFAVITAIMFVG